jgi:hypothetical protein
MHTERKLQFLTARRIPVRIEPADKIDRAPDGSPGAIVHVGTYVGGAAFDLDFVMTNIAIQHLYAAQSWLPHAHQHVERSGFPGAVGSDQRVDRPPRYAQGQRPQ